MATFKAEVQKQRKDGTFAVKIILTHKRKLKRLSTGIYITKNDMTRSGKIKNQAVLDKIEDLIREYRKKANSLSIAIEDMPIDRLSDILCEKKKDYIDFIEVFNEYIERNTSKKGIRNYRSALNSLIRFIGRDRLDIAEITASFLERYAISLGKGRAASLYIGSLRSVYSWAKLQYNDEESNRILIPYSPFSRFKVPKQNIAEKRAINASLIRKIISLPYDLTSRGKDKENRFNLAKDCFILSFGLIGMNSVDLYNAEICDHKTIIYYRTKTADRRKDHSKIQLDISDYIVRIFDKYRDKTNKKVFRFHMMYSSESNFNAAINKGLKKVGEKIGISDLEFYAARHSWATIARNDLSIDKETINEALNHADKHMAITDLYIKKDFSAINEANKKVLDYIFTEEK